MRDEDPFRHYVPLPPTKSGADLIELKRFLLSDDKVQEGFDVEENIFKLVGEDVEVDDVMYLGFEVDLNC